MVCSRINSSDVEAARERLLWRTFAGPRFGIGTDQERSLHDLLTRRTQSLFDRINVAAKRAGVQLDFSKARLQILAIQSLEGPCLYCGSLFGVDGFSVVYDVPPVGRHGAPASRGLANVVVCCARCGKGKDPLSGDEWRDVLAALKAADQVAAGLWLDAAIGKV